jgi:His/Glu/Gln/Arg/opine family amino acid ABC transporter permease subunit
MQVSFDAMTVLLVLMAELKAIPRTLGTALLTVTAGIVFGALLVRARAGKCPILSWPAAAFVSYMRGTPLVVQLYIIYYALPRIVVFAGEIFTIAVDPNEIGPFIVVLITYSMNAAAFQSEIIRGALASVEYGQVDAARSIGMTSWQTFRRIVAPQALAVAIPQFGVAYVGMIKMLSLAYMVSFVDIMAQAKLEAALNFRYIESYLAAAIVYWILCGTLSAFFARLENRLSRGRALA